MKKFLLRLHRRFILRTVRFWQTRWGERSLIILLAILIGAAAAIAAALLHMLVTRLEAFGIWLAGTPHDNHGFGWLGLLCRGGNNLAPVEQHHRAQLERWGCDGLHRLCGVGYGQRPHQHGYLG